MGSDPPVDGRQMQEGVRVRGSHTNSLLCEAWAQSSLTTQHYLTPRLHFPRLCVCCRDNVARECVYLSKQRRPLTVSACRERIGQMCNQTPAVLWLLEILTHFLHGINLLLLLFRNSQICLARLPSVKEWNVEFVSCSCPSLISEWCFVVLNMVASCFH